MNLSPAERRILRAALREFAASHESDFPTLREYHPFLRVKDVTVNVGELGRKLGVRLEQKPNR